MATPAKVTFVVLSLAFLVAGIALPAVLRGRVAREVVAMCERRTGARCSVGSTRVAWDGVLITDLRVEWSRPRARVVVQRVGARLNWTRLALKLRQSVSARVDGVAVNGDADPESLRALLRRLRDTPGGSGTGKVRVARLELDHLRADLRLRQPSGRTLSVRVEDLSATRGDDQVLSLRWQRASVEEPLGGGTLERCVALRRPDLATLHCGGFSVTADVASEDGVSEVADGWIAAFRPAAPGSRAGPLEGGRPTPWSVNLREGRVRVTRRARPLVDANPATLSAQGDGDTPSELRLVLGAEGGGEAVLGIGYTRTAAGRWELDLDATGVPLERVAPWVPMVPWHERRRGRVAARLRITPSSSAHLVEAAGEVSLEDFGLNHRGIAREALEGLAMSVSGRLLIDLARRRVTTAGVDLALNGMRLALSGWVERDRTHTAMDVAMHLPVIDCDVPRRVLPAVAVGSVAAMRLSGSLSADGHLAVDTRHLGDTRLDFHVNDGCRVQQHAPELAFARFGRPFVQRAQEPGGVVRAFVTGPGTPAWVPFASISPFVVSAVVHREDGGFFRHHGFSPDEVRGALVRNLTAGRFAFGASTITMQLVKNVFLAREKTLVRKLQEVALTWWVEQSVDKNSILELYLNVVEFGPGIYGIGPAARYFFGREPAELTVLQAIYLATLLPAPVARFANFERGSLGTEQVSRLRAVARGMVAAQLLSAGDGEAAQREVFAFRRASDPVPGAVTLTVAPETTDEMAGQIAEREGVRPSAVVASSSGASEAGGERSVVEGEGGANDTR